MVNENREILNHTHSVKSQREGHKEKSEPDLLVKNDFSAHLFIEELSFEGRNREEEGKKKRGRLLHEKQWQGKVMTSMRRWTETEHKGTKEGQTEEPDRLRSDPSVQRFEKHRGKRHLFFITLQHLSPPGGFFTSFWLSRQKIGPADVSSTPSLFSSPTFSPILHQTYTNKIHIFTILSGSRSTRPTLYDFHFTKEGQLSEFKS